MKIALFSDIHANKHALEAVQKDVEGQRVDCYWCLGDTVGYGPHPAPAVRWLQARVEAGNWVLGNHDAMLANLLTPNELEMVNETPQEVIELNRTALAQEPEADAFWRAEFTRQREQPRLHPVDGVDYLLMHGRQSSPLFRYLYSWQKEIHLPVEFKLLQAQARERGRPRVQCFGHTHVPTLVLARPEADQEAPAFEPVFILPFQPYPLETELVLLNPGSVGQPRDLDRRASYAILDTLERTVTFRRVAYDWRATARDLALEGYPNSLVKRLKEARPSKETPQEWLDHYTVARETRA